MITNKKITFVLIAAIVVFRIVNRNQIENRKAENVWVFSNDSFGLDFESFYLACRFLDCIEYEQSRYD